MNKPILIQLPGSDFIPSQEIETEALPKAVRAQLACRISSPARPLNTHVAGLKRQLAAHQRAPLMEASNSGATEEAFHIGNSMTSVNALLHSGVGVGYVTTKSIHDFLAGTPEYLAAAALIEPALIELKKEVEAATAARAAAHRETRRLRAELSEAEARVQESPEIVGAREALAAAEKAEMEVATRLQFPALKLPEPVAQDRLAGINLAAVGRTGAADAAEPAAEQAAPAEARGPELVPG